ncbi:hypothetical protein [Haloferula sp.]
MARADVQFTYVDGNGLDAFGGTFSYTRRNPALYSTGLTYKYE